MMDHGQKYMLVMNWKALNDTYVTLDNKIVYMGLGLIADIILHSNPSSDAYEPLYPHVLCESTFYASI